jgi:DNA primase
VSTGHSPDFKELVRSRTNLVDLVGENVALKGLRGGTDFVGLCPFHEDHNPSFHVYPDRGTYRCWVCNEGGDCFSFAMKYEGVEFREALEMLAKRAGLEMPRPQRPDRPFGEEGGAPVGRGGPSGSPTGSAGVPVIAKNELYDVLDWAQGVFHDCLLKSPAAAPAREYLLGRGFTQETIERFKLGYHPADWNFIPRLSNGKFSRLQLIASTVVGASRDNADGYYSHFFDRVIFPIHDERGRTVAFGGRIIPGRGRPEDAKYKNSNDSPVFHKSRLVFGLHAARDAIRKSDPPTAVVVEGYADCIMCHQHGLTNVVGTLGTALAESHVDLLKRFVRRVVLVFDADGAGKAAAERALGKFLAQDVDLRVLTLPEGSKDPDEFLQKFGADAFRELVKSATDVLDYKLARVVARHGLETAGGREAVLQEMLETVAEGRELAGTPREDRILQWLSQRLLTKEETVRRTLQKHRSDRERRVSARPMQAEAQKRVEPRRIDFLLGKRTRHDLLEGELLEILLTAPEWADEVRWRVSVDDFHNEHLRDLAQFCFDMAEDGEVPSLDRVLSSLEDPGLKQLAVLLDEMARKKGVLDLLAPGRPQSAGVRGPNTSGSNGTGSVGANGQPLPVFLTQTIHQLTWRRQEQRHEKPRHEVAQLTNPSSGLDDEAKALLKRMQDHHSKRAGKPG